MVVKSEFLKPLSKGDCRFLTIGWLVFSAMFYSAGLERYSVGSLIVSFMFAYRWWRLSATKGGDFRQH